MVITTLDTFGLLKRLGTVPLDSLVETLRDIHQRGGDLKSVDALMAASPPQEPIPPAAPASRAEAPDYEAARRHFVEHARRLREQALLAEQLLDGVRRHEASKPPSWNQRELSIVCRRGERSGGRFVVANCFEHAINVEFRPGRIHGADDGGGDVLTFEPAAPHLAAGAETLVRVGIDLTAWDKAETFDVGVDVLGNGRLLFKLWVRAESPGREEQGGTDTL